METLRKYGAGPYRIILLHGGPGGGGELKPVAEKLSQDGEGVLEPILRGRSIDAQVKEIKDLIDREVNGPVILIGHSWGAMLGYVFASRFPDLALKLILVGSGPFEAEYAKQILPTRLSRLSRVEKEEFDDVVAKLDEISDEGLKNELFNKLGAIIGRTDSKDVWPAEPNDIVPDVAVYDRVWAQAEQMRSDGVLWQCGKNISCPVVAIHGDYDPHPTAGVKVPLKNVLKDFRMIELKNCGHYPWREKAAKDEFFRTIKNELELVD